MARIDRYILSQLLVMFGFFALVLVAIFWINRAVVLFDRLIGDGQSALVFAEFTALGLPRLILTVIPIASFAATVYVTNRLSNESELTVMQATGSGPFRLARPVFLFALTVFAMSSVLCHVLAPMAQARLTEREEEISRNVTARLLTEGTFLHPTRGVTFYTRSIGSDGVLRDVFLSDRRNAEEGVIYTAAEAYLVRSGDGTTLIMVDGMAQRLTQHSRRLATANFRDFSFDISALVRNDSTRRVSVRALVSSEFLTSWPRLAERIDQDLSEIVTEFNGRLAAPLFAGVAAMVGFATLLVGGYSRFGIWREVVIAFGILLLLDGLRSALEDVVLKDPTLWPLVYMPSGLGTLIVLGLLGKCATPRRAGRAKPAVAA
ncbi:LPS export ABC transporter permease LptF [Sulfitobacter sp. D35]|uniref:LPS export ABC transporter permease LptF n=1 Tax=Sulfitobacter sp. D35 TaxID=3083252 RepID=UPI00296FD5EE|nr:LPS export ABC transporter permease LptF [Sulfitobacter sp. D35]MDW4497626.1 LPS export ABC transporter permease LptF [Sulfitobacter sp. D35]